MQLALLSQPNYDQYPTAMQNIGGKNEKVYAPSPSIQRFWFITIDQCI